MRRTVTAGSLALTATLCLSSSTAQAAALEGEAEVKKAVVDAPAEDPALAEAKALYKEGEIKFRTAEYVEALGLWKRAFGILPEGEDTRSIRNRLVYNIAEAHSKAYEVNRNPSHLRKAKLLLENYQAEHQALYGEGEEAKQERAEAGERIKALDAKIVESEAAGEEDSSIVEPAAGTETGQGDTGEEGAAPSAQGDTAPGSRQRWEQELEADPVLGPKWDKSNRRVVGGAVMTGIGGIFGLIAVGSFGIVPGSVGVFGGAPVGLIATGAVTGVIALGLLIPGGILLHRGIKGRKEVLGAKPRPSAMVLPVPVLTPDGRGGGFGVALRF